MTASPQVFVSYSHHDAERVTPLIADLRAAGVDVWFDAQLTPGIDWSGELARAIDTCQLCIYFVSKMSVASQVCEREVNLAVRRDRRVLPVYLEDTQLTPELELSIGNLQAIRTAPSSGADLVAVVNRLLTGGEAGGLSTRNEATATPHERPERVTVRRAWPMLLLVISVAVAGTLLLTREQPGEPALPENPRIAVLAFENFSGDAANDYLGRSLAEELLDAFTAASRLRVIARTASFYYAGKDLPFSRVASDLRADLVLEGSLLSREGDELRFATQLIDAATEAHIWSKVYVIPLNEVIDVKNDIASEVLGALNEQTGAVSALPQPFDGAAYDLYLQGRDALRRQRDRAGIDRAMGLFADALEITPGFEPARAGLCESYLDAYVLERRKADFDTASNLCQALLEDDAQSTNALYALGTLNRLSNNLDLAVDYYRRTLAIDGDAEPALYGLGRCLEAQGAFAAAEQYIRRSVDAAPSYWRAHIGLAGFLARRGRYLDTAAAAERVIALDPDNPIGHATLGTAYFAVDRWEEAEAPLVKSLELDASRFAYASLAALYYYDHRVAEARELLEVAVDRYPDDYRLLGKLAAAVRVQNREDAAPLYERAWQTTTGALAVNADDGVLVGYHAYYAAALGRTSEARDTISRALALQPDNPEVHYLLAYVRLLTNDAAPWQDARQQALNLGYSARQSANDPMFAGR